MERKSVEAQSQNQAAKRAEGLEEALESFWSRKLFNDHFFIN